MFDRRVDEFFVSAVERSLPTGQAALLLCRDIAADDEVNDRVIEKLAASGGRLLATNRAPNWKGVCSERSRKRSAPPHPRRSNSFELRCGRRDRVSSARVQIMASWDADRAAPLSRIV